MGPDTIVPLAGILMIVVLGTPIVRVIARRIERAGSSHQASMPADDRLERIEHAIDAMAVEIERISEGQRFLTKILAEGATPASIGAPNESMAKERVR